MYPGENNTLPHAVLIPNLPKPPTESMRSVSSVEINHKARETKRDDRGGPLPRVEVISTAHGALVNHQLHVRCLTEKRQDLLKGA
jgi:hypothetical protein